MTVFLVRRVAWVADEDVWRPVGDGVGRPRRAFAGRAAAEAYAARLRQSDALGRNPFAYDVPRPSSFDRARLHDWLLDCGFPPLPPAAADLRVLHEWWHAHAAALADWQRARAWEAFDRVRLYDVVEVDLSE